MSELLSKLEMRFSSGNCIPVERAHITADEFAELRGMVSAAPYLLEALQMYRAVVGNTGYALSRESAAELYAKASEVIAKATGEPE